MSNQAKFNPQKRFCIAKGAEGCPACVASIHNVRETESFTTISEELGPIEESVLGICLITNGEIVVGGKCDVPDMQFTAWTLK